MKNTRNFSIALLPFQPVFKGVGNEVYCFISEERSLLCRIYDLVKLHIPLLL